MPTVILAEDGTLLRVGMESLLTRFDFDVTASVPTADALLTAVDHQPPDLVITDIRMPPTHTDEGIQAAHRLRRTHPTLPIVLLSQYVEKTHAADLLQTPGGLAYLLKDRVVDVPDFITTLHAVLNGATVIDPEVVRQLLNRPTLTRLSPREHEVLTYVAEGASNSAIAAKLVLSEAAVGKHIGNILAKLNLPPTPDTNRRVQAVLAYLNGTR